MRMRSSRPRSAPATCMQALTEVAWWAWQEARYCNTSLCKHPLTCAETDLLNAANNNSGWAVTQVRSGPQQQQHGQTVRNPVAHRFQVQCCRGGARLWPECAHP